MRKKATTPMEQETNEIVTKSIIAEISIDGIEKISVTTLKRKEKVTKRNGKQGFRVLNRETLEVKTEKNDYLLKEVSKEELKEYRKNGTPSFVLKTLAGSFYTEVPEDFSLVSVRTNFNHKCATCQRLSAASDENGGCSKVRAKSRGIEKFGQIISGIETFNVCETNFLVNECWYYKKINERDRKNHTI